ncbi:MAG: tRNA (adenosine(37)-N6)-dimethylallyltransferase MiaA [Legionellales bacterium RIFCSPHIGHO2_12_FULL_35_11]|nr:MAG: tRNA (adenosine(37)-N6)-dimethylallyltransferase MiaA [Legionellales bacterium RIFCSPHIGHO2_12_FULL_35_11]
MSKVVFCLIGPTASGKTDLAIELVDKYPFEIISIDSAMIYREMNIGTAKPSQEILSTVPHHLIDIIDPIGSYSVANCLSDIENLCEDIISRQKIPLLVGGTMMYFNAVQNGLSQLPTASKENRLEVLSDMEKYGLKFLHQQLQEVDPISAAKINENDSQRIQRAIEVYRITGKPLSSLILDSKNKLNFDFVNLCLVPENRSWLHNRIEQRFKIMLTEGLIYEAEQLLVKWRLDVSMPAMRCVGYRQVLEYISGNIDYNLMVENGIAATRQLAKRQLTWLRKWPNANIFFADNQSNLLEIMELITKILDNPSPGK